MHIRAQSTYTAHAHTWRWGSGRGRKGRREGERREGRRNARRKEKPKPRPLLSEVMSPQQQQTTCRQSHILAGGHSRSPGACNALVHNVVLCESHRDWLWFTCSLAQEDPQPPCSNVSAELPASVSWSVDSSNKDTSQPHRSQGLRREMWGCVLLTWELLKNGVYLFSESFSSQRPGSMPLC